MSDRYERCAHNERPSKCINCSSEQIERLERELAETRELLREAKSAIEYDTGLRWSVRLHKKIDAFLSGKPKDGGK